LLAAGIYDRKPEKGKEMLQIAAEQSDRLVRLVNDILDLQQLESGKVQLEVQVCETTTLIQHPVEAMRSSALVESITLETKIVPLQVWAAPDAIAQTLTNLLSNAIKFSPPNSTIPLSVTPLSSTCSTSRSFSPTPPHFPLSTPHSPPSPTPNSASQSKAVAFPPTNWKLSSNVFNRSMPLTRPRKAALGSD
jgi:hypothetical protein